MLIEEIEKLLEAVMVAHGKPLSEKQLLDLFAEHEQEVPTVAELREALGNLQAHYEDRGFKLVEVASGFLFQTNKDYGALISKLWEEKPARYSKALLETLALIAYRQPITRGEIEQIRGVSISSSIFKTLLDDRGWIRVVGHRDVPGKPGLYATTKQFLDYFGVKSLDELPPLPEIMKLGEDDEQKADVIDGEQKPEQLTMDELEAEDYSDYIAEDEPELEAEDVAETEEAEAADEIPDNVEYLDNYPKEIETEAVVAEEDYSEIINDNFELEEE